MPILFSSPFPLEHHGEHAPSPFRRIADAATSLLLILDGFKFLSILLREPEDHA